MVYDAKGATPGKRAARTTASAVFRQHGGVCARYGIRFQESWESLYAKYTRRIYPNMPHGARMQMVGKKVEQMRAAGFNAALYEMNGNSVLVFEGSDSNFTGPDWTRTNLPNLLGRSTKQYSFAGELALAAKSRHGNKLIVTGHSLGGGLATQAAAKNRLDAVIFNPAYPKGRAHWWTRRHVKSFVMSGEIVAKWHPGSPAKNTLSYPNKCGGSIAKHKMDCVLRTLRAAAQSCR